MKRIILVCLLLIMVVPAMAQDALPERDSITVSFEGISLTLPTALAGSLDVALVPEQPYEEQNTPFWDVYPETIMFTAGDYSDGTEFFHTPSIRFYRLDDDMSRFGPEEFGFLREMTEMVDLFNAMPDLQTYVGSDQNTHLPFLPVFNAAQVFRAKPEFIASDYVVGVRYLTFYAQDFFPVADTQLLYTFQGASLVDNYLISVTLPISSGQLLEPGDDFDYETFSATADQYMEATALMLNGLDDNRYMPTIPMLDEFVLSIVIAEPEGSPAG